MWTLNAGIAGPTEMGVDCIILLAWQNTFKWGL